MRDKKQEELISKFEGAVIYNEGKTSSYRIIKNMRTNGQYSTIFTAQCQTNQVNPYVVNQQVIVKVLKKEMEKYNTREINAHSLLQKTQNVLRMFDLCVHEGLQCLVLEYCNGGDLEYFKNHCKYSTAQTNSLSIEEA